MIVAAPLRQCECHVVANLRPTQMAGGDNWTELMNGRTFFLLGRVMTL